MKLLICLIISVISFNLIVCADVKASADQLIAKVDEVVESIKSSHPDEAKILKEERVKLGLLVLNLEWAQGAEATNIENQIRQLESTIEAQLAMVERGEKFTANPSGTTAQPGHTTVKPHSSTNKIKSTLSCEATPEFFDRLADVVTKINVKVTTLMQQHKSDEAIALLDKVKEVIDLQKKLETMVKAVNLVVKQVDDIDQNIN